MSRFTASLNATQKQSLGHTLSPQMQRAMHLMQLCRDELEKAVSEICEANPLISDDPAWSRSRRRGNTASETGPPASSPVSLVDHLGRQLALSSASRGVKRAAARLITHLGPDGRLAAEDWAELARHTHARAGLRLVQSFEPAGVGARSLCECFALQLDDARAQSPAWQALIANLDALATDRAEALARRCGTSPETLGEMIAHLRTLDPHPGHRYETADRIEITPDLRAQTDASGAWSICLTWDPSASIILEPGYKNWQSDAALTAPARSFLDIKQAEVDWLKRALKQRGQTLLRVARLAIRRQERFLADGEEYLKPLTMREIATRLDLHESTVSRAVANKFILTPRGVLPMRSFFSTVVSHDVEQADTSSAAIRARIGLMIADEASPGRMSDQAISEALRTSGIRIARRSVAKHREHLGLGSARERARLAGFDRLAS